MTGDDIGQPLSGESPYPGCRCCLRDRRQHELERPLQDQARPGVVEDPGMYRRFSRGNREISTPASNPLGSRHQREGDEPKPMRLRCGEVGRADSTDEACEQGGRIRGGARGGKRCEGEECGLAKHGPDTEPDHRVPCAGSHTQRASASRHALALRAGCGNPARPDLCGGRSVMTVPTATLSPLSDREDRYSVRLV